MKIRPTENGDLELVLEDQLEWLLLFGLLQDGAEDDFDLAARLGGPDTPEEVRADWREFVCPDLRERFAGERRVVEDALMEARRHLFVCPHTLTIGRQDMYSWYARLNHARLALEARWGFGPDPDLERDGPPGFGNALLREAFYRHIQSLLLEQGLGLA